MHTEPSGKQARISSLPPMAAMNLESVPIYISVRRSILEMLACLMPSMVARCSWVRFRAARSSSSGILASVSRAMASLRAWASGDIFDLSSLKFRAFAILFFLQFFQVLSIQAIRHWNEDFIPAVISGFVAADQ